MRKKNLWLLISLLLAVMLALAACAGGEAPAEDAGGEEDTAAEADAGGEEDTAAEADAGGEEEAPAGDEPGTMLARAEAGEFDGTEVNVFGAFVDVDAERFDATILPFEESTGIDVVYEGSGDFESLITVRVEGGDPPDVAAFPQPGLMADLARRGALVDLGNVLDTDQLAEDFIPAWINLGTVNDQLVGIFHRANLKSLVWYPIPEFEEAGYEEPQTWDEMIALSDQIVADGSSPWCIGMESSGATGWVATDWVEDIMLRTAGPEVYDQWVRHEIPFNDPAVKNAVEIMGEIWLNPDYVLGGTTAILTVPFGDAQTPMFDDPPSCWLHRQASFIPGFFPNEGEEVGTETWFFYLPPIDEEQGKPVLGAGDAYSMFNDRPEVRAFMEYMATAESAQGWAEAGGFLSPHKQASLEWYPDEATRLQAEILQNATTFRFDASDLMPGSVGTGSFWTGMVDYVNGDDLDAVLQRIEDSWPADAGGAAGTGDTSEEAEEPAEGEEGATDEGSEEGSMESPSSEVYGAELAAAEAGDYEGTEVNVFGAFVDVDAERFDATVQPFEESTGIDVVYEGSGDFESLITVRVEGGDPPDVAAFPQPGLMADLARREALVDLGTVLNTDQMTEDYIQAWIDLGTVDDTLVGVFHRANLKSLVWYPIPEFEEAGYTVPETWDEMIALSDQMVADGNTPWCIGMESSGATGWVATDWVEDIMLRTAGPEVYDQWVNHEIPFNDPAVLNAVQIMGDIWLNPDYVLGGTTAILTVPFGDAQTPMFDDPPACWLHRQASFIPGFFPKEGEEVGTETWFFYLPPIDEAQGKPVLGAGDAYSMFNDRPEVRAFMQYLATAESAEGWAGAGGFLSPHNKSSLEWYPDEGTRAQAEILRNATTFRFDASDLMPGSVGTGSFWTGMVDYVNGDDPEAVLQRIEDSWPAE